MADDLERSASPPEAAAPEKAVEPPVLEPQSTAMTSTFDSVEAEAEANNKETVEKSIMEGTYTASSLALAASGDTEKLANDEDEDVDEDEDAASGKVKEVCEEDEEPLLSEDAYSLLFTSPLCSTTSIFAGFSISLQVGMLLVTFLDLFDYSAEGNDTNGNTNRVQIPAGSSIQVMIAQFIGMLLTAMVMAAEGDFVIGITKLIKGYDYRIREQSPNASWPKWLITGLLQSISGLLLLIDSFILSMQSSTVIDLTMNLTALHFIQEIDNMSFSLGEKSGLCGEDVEADCKHVKSVKGYSTPTERKRKLFRRRALIAFMTLGLLVPYFVLADRQLNGHYVCDTLFIQFGDAYIPEMAHYSGIFNSPGNELKHRKGQRNYYVNKQNTYIVAFCNAENYWTISKVEDDNPCEFIYRSASTETFDIIEAAEEHWFVASDTTGEIDADWLEIVCNECNPDTCDPQNGQCSEDNDWCICREGRYGVNCELELECNYFALDRRTRDGLSAIPGTSSFLDTQYITLREPRKSNPDEMKVATTFYDMPIYVPGNRRSFEIADQIDSFIIFTGRRWALYSIPDDKLALVVEKHGTAGNWTSTDFIEYFENLDDRKAYPTFVQTLMQLTSDLYSYYPLFFSSPLNYGESTFGFDPSSVTWVQATLPYDDDNPLVPANPDEAQPVTAKFLCTACSGDNSKCLNGGFCHSTGTCSCPAFYTGFQCERVKDCVGAGGCSGAGTCDRETKTCECDEGSFGSLCQLGEGAAYVKEPYLCDDCQLYQHGKCNSTWSSVCICDPGWTGPYCNQTV